MTNPYRLDPDKALDDAITQSQLEVRFEDEASAREYHRRLCDRRIELISDLVKNGAPLGAAGHSFAEMSITLSGADDGAYTVRIDVPDKRRKFIKSR